MEDTEFRMNINNLFIIKVYKNALRKQLNLKHPPPSHITNVDLNGGRQTDHLKILPHLLQSLLIAFHHERV
jgi:hypothetical protein